MAAIAFAETARVARSVIPTESAQMRVSPIALESTVVLTDVADSVVPVRKEKSADKISSAKIPEVGVEMAGASRQSPVLSVTIRGIVAEEKPAATRLGSAWAPVLTRPNVPHWTISSPARKPATASRERPVATSSELELDSVFKRISVLAVETEATVTGATAEMIMAVETTP